MNTRLIQAVLKFAAAQGNGNPATDAVLLRTFADSHDEAAFAEIVRRYSRLVWSVCRQLRPTDADAEDAFQATFLVLLRSAKSIRTNALGPWLHTVAHRVSCKANRAESKRKSREQLVASADRYTPVPSSAWDSMMAAVHEEVANLPEHLRVPFVMCCLEGRGTTEAAEQLGWKLGTLSGRLTRAKQALLDRLEKRGLPISAVAAGAFTLGTATSAPATVVAKALDLIHRGDAIPSTILVLAKGTMTMSKTKLLAAAVMLTAGLTASIGGWMMSANAQTPDVVKEVKQLARSLDAKPASKWEYKYEQLAKHIDGFGEYVKDFERLMEQREQQGWTYLGQASFWFTEKGGIAPYLVFRRPSKPITSDDDSSKLALRLDEAVMQQARVKADPAKTAASEAAARERVMLFKMLLAQARSAEANPAIDAVRDTILQRMQKDPKETFAAALEVKLKASPELAPAVEKYGRTVLEVDVLSALLAEARGVNRVQRAFQDADIKPAWTMWTESSEADTVKKQIQELRDKASDRKTARFVAADYGITSSELMTVMMKAIDRKLESKSNRKPFDLTSRATWVDAVGGSADIEWLTKLMDSAKIKW